MISFLLQATDTLSVTVTDNGPDVIYFTYMFIALMLFVIIFWTIYMFKTVKKLNIHMQEFNVLYNDVLSKILDSKSYDNAVEYINMLADKSVTIRSTERVTALKYYIDGKFQKKFRV